MAKVQPNSPHRAGRRGTPQRRRVRLLVVALLALGVLVAAVAAGWVDWLIDHAGQASEWIQERWFAAPALGVFVALVGVIVAVAMPRWQQRRTELLAAAERDRQEQQKQAVHARMHEQAAIAAQTRWEQRCRQLLALWPLPRVEDVNPYEIGVFYSRRADAYRGNQPHPPYVTRALDEELAELLCTKPLILIKGQSRAGKSRTAFELAAHGLSGWRLLVPKDRAALAALGELDPMPGHGQPVLVWLDDLEEFLATEGSGGLDAALLGRWAASDPPVKVLATIRLEEHGRLATAPGELGRSTRELLNRFDPGALTLPVGFDTPAEQAAIATLYPGEQVTGGLAEHLAAAHELIDRLEVGEASAPVGAALVLAAIDWHRAGLQRPVAKADLRALLPLYLKRLRPLAGLTETDIQQGLSWATEAVGRTAALLVADPDPQSDTFRAADSIVDYVERRDGQRLADPDIWHHLLRRTLPKEALELGFAAHSRGEVTVSRMALQQEIDTGHPDWAPWAAVALGMLLEEQDDLAGARAAFRRAIDSDHVDAAPEAAALLGDLLVKEEDVAGAMAAFQQAIRSGHPEAFPRAAVGLGRLFAEQGDVVDAMATYQQAIDSDHPNQAPWAAFFLGMLLDDEGDVAGARAAYQSVINSGHDPTASMAESSLKYLAGHQRISGAVLTFQRVINSGDPNRAPWAAVALGMLLEEQEDMAGARAAYKQAIDSEHSAVAAHAQEALRNLEQRDG